MYVAVFLFSKYLTKFYLEFGKYAHTSLFHIQSLQFAIMETEKTLKLIKIYVTYGKFMGVIDVKFDYQTQAISKINKTHHSIRYFITLFLILVVRSVTYGFWIRDILSGNFGFEDKFDVLHLTVNFVSFYCVTNHLLNFWLRNEYPGMMNSFLRFYQKFQGKTKFICPIAQIPDTKLILRKFLELFYISLLMSIV